jgi:hypothetical protein
VTGNGPGKGFGKPAQTSSKLGQNQTDTAEL